MAPAVIVYGSFPCQLAIPLLADGRLWAYLVIDADVEYVVKAQQTSAASGSNDAQALQEVSQDGLKYCRNINAVAARVIREHAERERTRQLLRKKEADSVFENFGDQHQMDEGDKPYEDDEAAVADSGH